MPPETPDAALRRPAVPVLGAAPLSDAGIAVPPGAAAAPRRNWFAALRVRHWAHMLLLPLAGLESGVPTATSAVGLARGLAIAACLLAWGFLLNSLVDRTSDLERSKDPLAGSGLRLPALEIALWVLPAVALLLAVSGPSFLLVAVGGVLAAGWAYSTGPRLKRVPGVGTVTNAFLFAPLLFVAAPGPGLPPVALSLLGPFVALLLQNQLIHEAAGAAEDARAEAWTTWRRLGPGRTVAVAAGFGIAALLASWPLVRAGALPAWGALHAVPFVLAFPAALWWSRNDPSRLSRLRRTHRGVAALSGALLFGASLLTEWG